MRMKSLVLIFIALGCGLVASIGISQVMDRGRPSGDQMELDQILIALTDIDIGTKLDAQNVKLEDWPKGRIPEGAVRRLDQVKDKFASARFYRGEPLHVNKVSDRPGNNAANLIPDGYRAMPVKVEEDTVMKAISPGDRVDVMVFLKRGHEVPSTGVFTILKNVRVFAINTNTERSPDGKDNTNFRTVSLLVKPDHARELVLAAKMGKIILSLRRPEDSDDSLGEDVTPIADILKGRSKLGTDPDSNPAPLLGALRSGDDLESGYDAKWTMHIMGPGSVSQYEWQDLNKMPVQSRPGAKRPLAPADAAPPTAAEGDADGEWNEPTDADPMPAARYWLD